MTVTSVDGNPGTNGGGERLHGLLLHVDERKKENPRAEV
jgi:hypothetical protein